MKFISTKTHGFLDYVMGMLLIILPFLLHLGLSEPESIVLFVVGALMVLMAVMTRYELGVIRVIPMPAHLLADIMTGAILLFSPWLFGFAEKIYLPHLLLGVLEVLAALMTATVAGPSAKSI